MFAMQTSPFNEKASIPNLTTGLVLLAGVVQTRFRKEEEGGIAVALLTDRRRQSVSARRLSVDKSPVVRFYYSHSIVEGGLLVIS
ncbi:MAG: hypothetical protein U0M19_04360 [Caecibacter sp.]|nr:hypothetical protein [Caecibacter sp.]